MKIYKALLLNIIIMIQVFASGEDGAWKTVFHDPCTSDWKENWTLDGENAQVNTGHEGMLFTAGPKFGDDRDHAVLWTKASFKGDIRIDFEYTRTDEAVRGVNIIYIQATGSGVGPYSKDISEWADLRSIPHMWMYYRYMNTYHISYAAFGLDNKDPLNDYIRARRYMPEQGRGLKGTGLKPDYRRTGLFRPDVPHRITVIKTAGDLSMRISNGEETWECQWETDRFPPVLEGRIGLRHMYTRSARYRDLRISLKKQAIEGVVNQLARQGCGYALDTSADGASGGR